MTLAALASQLGLIVRQLSRNRRRTALTFAGLVISFFLFTSLESILYTLESVVSRMASETGLFLRPRGRVSFFGSTLPMDYVEDVRRMNGVVEAAAVRFYFGLGRYEGSFAAALAVEPDAYLRLAPLRGVTAQEARAFREGRTAALAGERLLERNDWKVGDRISIRGAGRLPTLTVDIVGDIDGDDRLGRVALVQLDYLEELLGDDGRATFIQARVESAGLAPAVARAIDDHFENYTVPTETVTERGHLATALGGLADALGALRSIGYLTLAVTVLVVGNSVAMSIRERTVEIGTLRALGFGRWRVMGLVLGEAVLVALPGGALGALLAWAFFETGVMQIPASRFTFTTDVWVVARATALAVPVGLLAGLQPAVAAVRMSITAALRYAD